MPATRLNGQMGTLIQEQVERTPASGCYAAAYSKGGSPRKFGCGSFELRRPLTPGPFASRLRNPSSWGEGGTCFGLRSLETKGTFFALNQPSFAFSILSFQKRVPSPQELGRGQGEGLVGNTKDLVRKAHPHQSPLRVPGPPFPLKQAITPALTNVVTLPKGTSYL